MIKNELKKENEYLIETKNVVANLITERENHIKYLSDYFDQYKAELVELIEKDSGSSYNKMDTYDKVALNTKLSDLNIDSQASHTEILQFKNIYTKPFFAKIVFENQQKQANEYYIGLKNITKDNKVYTVDWRAPISALYYDSKVGKTTYSSPKGPVEIDLKFKRQFSYEDKKIVNYIDSDSYINDEILIEALSKNSSNYMHNIVSTIQQEQDNIVRQSLNSNIIINGVAGSGKTSVAMHRIAYLLYKYNDKLTSSNIHIISPNKLFSNYISKLLPELGEKNVAIKSFYDVLIENAPSVKVIDSKMKLITDILNGNANRWKLAKLKYSQKYLEILLKYIAQFNDISILKNLKINNKIFSLKVVLPFYKKHKNSYSIFETVRNTIDELVTRHFPNLNEISQEALIEETAKTYCGKLDAVKITNNFLCKLSKNETATNQVNIEDLPTFTLVEMLTNGYTHLNHIKHVLIDEMQDYDAVTLKIINLLYSNATFTVVGDFNQNLLFDTNNLDSLNKIFENSLRVNLDKSYRSTNNIMELANKILNKNEPRQTLREGKNPTFVRCETKQTLVNEINKLVNTINKNDTTAIICKNEREATYIYKSINKGLLVTSEHTQINNDNLIITTTYFCKGLEFDNVIIPNASVLNYKNNLEKQNLYVTVTRALHNVYGFYLKNPCKFISQEFLK